MATDKQKAIHFGAGNIGRGFIGPLLAESGYHVVFADVNKGLIDTINEQHHYDVHILDRTEEQFEVDDVSAVLSTTDDIVNEIADPRTALLTTAVGVTVLDKIASTIARGLHARRTAGGGTLNIIACENTIGATSRLHRKVEEALTDDADKEYVAAHVGFANCSVDRIVPPFDLHDPKRTLDVGVEGFYEWIVEGPSLKGEPKPDIRGWRLTDNLPAFNERKLFTLNTGHAICAYLGSLKGLETIDQSIQHPEIRHVVRGALEESGAALIKKHGFDKEEHEQYINKVEERFKNPSVKDEVSRVGRQPLRKLGKEDRLVGPTNMAKGYDMSVTHLTIGIAAALRFHNDTDEESKDLQKSIKEKGVEVVVSEVTGFEHGTDEHKKIVDAYHGLESFKVAN